MDGWNLEGLWGLDKLLEQLSDLKYEIEKCQRGALTGAETHAELGKYMQKLGEKLQGYGREIEQELE